MLLTKLMRVVKSALNLFIFRQTPLFLFKHLTRVSLKTSNTTTVNEFFKNVLSIDADNSITAMELARSISFLDVVNFISASWNNDSTNTIRNCFSVV